MRKFLFLISSFSLSTPAVAQDPAITVLGTGSMQPVEDAGQSISVIGADELDSIRSPDLATVLQRLPGVSLSRNGSAGAFTGLFVRGASSQQVLAMVDGIRVADVASPSGGTDLGTLSASGLGKVELLRGSNSVVWGSDAIGGVLAVTTRAFDDGATASLEYGARNSLNAEAGFGMQESSYELAVAAGYSDTDGFSSAAGGTEPDGFRQWRAQGRARIGIAQNLGVTLAGRWADSRVAFDGFSFSPPFGLIDRPEYSDVTEWSARGGVEYVGSDLRLEAAYAFHDLRRDNFNPDFGPDPTFAAKGRDQRAELKGNYTLSPDLSLTFGADHAWERFSTTFDTRKKASNSSAHALLGWQGERLKLAAGARIDDHSGFGSHWTFGANGSFRLGDGWRVRASYGEGFKAPTLYQLHSDFGNAALVPERSRSYDVGIEKGDRNGPLFLALTLFRRDSRNLIDFAACSGDVCINRPFGRYENVGRARAQGFELELGAQVSERFHAQAAYTYLEAKDRTAGGFNLGNDLARRPRHAVTVSLDWDTPVAGLALGGDLRMAGKSFDDAGNFTRLESYALATLRAALPLTERIELFGRLENVTDAQYETAAGYATAGRSAYFGARARF